MRERRKHKRQNSDKYPTVYDGLTTELIGGLANLSPEGAMFITSGPIKASTSFRCRVELSPQILGLNEIVFDAECRWCRKNIKIDRWESGYSLKMTGINKELISYLTLSYKLDYWDDGNLRDVITIEMENRRKSARFELDEPLPVFELHNYRQIGVLADLSTQGVRLITHKPIDKNGLLCCRVMLSKKVFQQDYLIFDTKCMWCRKEKGSVKYESGHRITNISEQDAAIILHFLIHYAKAQQTSKRIHVVK